MRKYVLGLLLFLLVGVGVGRADDYSASNITVLNYQQYISAEDESPAQLLDGNKSTKRCTWNTGDFNHGGSPQPYANRNPDKIVWKTASSITMISYTLTTGGDTQYYPARNWKSWTICGGNFASDEAAASAMNDSEGWTIIDQVANDATLPNENTTDATFACSNPGTYKYYRLVVDAVHQEYDYYSDVQQMSELTMHYTPVSLPAASVTAAPTAKTGLIYNGSAQALVNAGTATNGTMYYSLDNSDWSSAIPTAKNAGNYTVYYKVVGDESHADYTPSSNTVAVTIGKEPLNRVVAVADGRYVVFSPGNLQYQASTNTWRFGEHQYTNLRSSGGNLATTDSRATQSEWIDLFGWGTSGWNNTAVDATAANYQPWACESTNYSGSTADNQWHYGPSTNIVAANKNWSDREETKNYDWGVYNASQLGVGWRVPTMLEWKYICNDRTPDSGVRYAKATVNGIVGLILLPEDWSTSYYSLSSTNNKSVGYSTNVISLSDWTTYLEAHGATFLPVTGYREWTTLYSAGDDNGYARYWSSTPQSTNEGYNLIVKPNDVDPINGGRRSRGYGVRLVKEVAAAPKGKWLRAKGSAQALVDAGSSSTGTMLYSLDNSSWSSAIPTATAVGNYIVYYKIQGDANHEDFTPNSNSVQATIFVEDGWVDSWQSDSVVVRTNAFDLTGKTATILTNDVERATGLTTTATDAGYWRIAAELNSYAGQELRIVFYNNTTPVCFIDTIVPYVVSSNTTLSNYTAFPTGEHIDVQVVSDTLTFNVGYQIGTLDVYAGAKVVVTSSHDLGVDAIVMRADAIHDRYSRLVANAAITDNTTPTDPVRIYYDYTLDYAQFYTLAVPFDVNCADIRTKSGKAASYEVQWYDGAERAKNTEAWTVLDDQAPGATLHAGQGYAVFGVPYKWNGTRQQTTVLRFPMGGDFEYGEAQKSVSVSAYSTSGTAPSNRNWNLIGNPYLTRFKHGDNNARLMIGHYTPDGSDPSVEHYTYVEDDVRYITYSTDGFQTYTQARATTTEMLPFHAYFIQAASTGTLTFTVDGGRRENAPRRLTANGEPQERALGIVLRSTDSEDATGLLYGEAFTNGYDMNADLVKLFGSAQGMSVYTLAGGEERAFNALAAIEAEAAVAVGFRFAPVGQPLTFALDEEQYDLGQLEAMLLTDHATHTTVDLLSQPYVFTTAKAQDNTRFSISVRWRQEVPTGIENGQTTNDGFVQVYDLLGRPVTYDDPPAGVYIILENGQSRKEVIR